MQQYKLKNMNKLKYYLFGIVSLFLHIGVQAKPTTLLFCEPKVGLAEEGNISAYQIILNDDNTLHAGWYTIPDTSSVKYDFLAEASRSEMLTYSEGEVGFIEAVKNQHGTEKINSRMITYFSGKSGKIKDNKFVTETDQNGNVTKVYEDEKPWRLYVNPKGGVVTMHFLSKIAKKEVKGQSWRLDVPVGHSQDLYCSSSSNWVDQNKKLFDDLKVPAKSVFPLKSGIDRNTKNNYCTFRLLRSGIIGDLRSIQWNIDENNNFFIQSDSIKSSPGIVKTNTMAGIPSQNDEYNFSYIDNHPLDPDKNATYGIKVTVNETSARVGYEKIGKKRNDTTITDTDCVVKSLKKDNEEKKG